VALGSIVGKGVQVDVAGNQITVAVAGSGLPASGTSEGVISGPPAAGKQAARIKENASKRLIMIRIYFQ
jgi:hypothetical protein